MGLDVRIQVIGSDAIYDHLDHRMIEVNQSLDNWSPASFVTFDDSTEDYSTPIEGGFQLDAIMRYYGPGYERGNWPTIYGTLVALQRMFPQSSIFYGDDCSGYRELVNDAFYDMMWNHWNGPNGHDYRKNMTVRSY